LPEETKEIAMMIKMLGLAGIATIAAIISQTGDADAVSCTTATFPVNNGQGGLKCCKPAGDVTQACGNLNSNVNVSSGGFTCNVSGIGRMVSAGLMSPSSTEARTTCLNGGSGTTTLSDFSANGLNNNRCDVGTNCAGANNFKVQSF
jgi:hypothetical protein